jgi:hypothetical protein
MTRPNHAISLHAGDDSKSVLLLKRGKLSWLVRQSTHAVILATIVFIIVGCASRRANYTRGQSGVCEVHSQTMQKVVVPTHFGLMALSPRDQAMLSASDIYFPHADDSINPGCDPSRGPREAVIYSCPTCLKARRQWEASYDSQH